MTINITSEKMAKVLTVLQNDPEAIQTLIRKQQSTDPVAISPTYSQLIQSQVPIEFKVEVPAEARAIFGKWPVRLRLPEGYADTEVVDISVIRPYNQAMAILGMEHRFSVDLNFANLCRAHELIYNYVSKPVSKPVTPAANEAAPMPKEAPKVQATEKRQSKPKTHLWAGKPCTEAQFESWAKRAGGYDKVPLDSGEIGIVDDAMPIDPIDIVLQDDEHVVVEVVDDIVVPVAIIKRVIVEQQPDSDAKAKAVDMDLIRELLEA